MHTSTTQFYNQMERLNLYKGLTSDDDDWDDEDGDIDNPAGDGDDPREEWNTYQDSDNE